MDRSYLILSKCFHTTDLKFFTYGRRRADFSCKLISELIWHFYVGRLSKCNKMKWHMFMSLAWHKPAVTPVHWHCRPKLRHQYNCLRSNSVGWAFMWFCHKMFLLVLSSLTQVPEVTHQVVTVFLASSKWHATGHTYQSILGGHRPWGKWCAELINFMWWPPSAKLVYGGVLTNIVSFWQIKIIHKL